MRIHGGGQATSEPNNPNGSTKTFKVNILITSIHIFNVSQLFFS